MLYARGQQVPGYWPTLFDAAAVIMELFDKPPLIVNQVKLSR